MLARFRGESNNGSGDRLILAASASKEAAPITSNGLVDTSQALF